MIGLGPVSPPVETGAAAPADPPAVVEAALSCEFGTVSPSPPASFGKFTVSSAKLTPGAVGTYQITVPMPAQVGKEHFLQIVCGVPGSYTGGVIPVSLPDL